MRGFYWGVSGLERDFAGEFLKEEDGRMSNELNMQWAAGHRPCAYKRLTLKMQKSW